MNKQTLEMAKKIKGTPAPLLELNSNINIVNKVNGEYLTNLELGSMIGYDENKELDSFEPLDTIMNKFIIATIRETQSKVDELLLEYVNNSPALDAQLEIATLLSKYLNDVSTLQKTLTKKYKKR